MSEKNHLLIFPKEMDSAQRFARYARTLGFKISFASSAVSFKTSAIKDCYYLPYITADNFEEAFSNLARRLEITHVYTPHVGVWVSLNKLSESGLLNFELFLNQPHPFEAIWDEHSISKKWANAVTQYAYVNYLASNVTVKSSLTEFEYSGLHKKFLDIPGQCDEDKLFDLCEVARVLPDGDIIEIGTLYGRSAITLSWLAKKYQLGNVLCIDHWFNEKSDHQGKSAELLNSQIDSIRFDNIFSIFMANAALQDNIGYIKKKSADAHTDYLIASKKGEAVSENLGSIKLNGTIALLHIDGNHRYDQVKKDIELWTPLVASGGWILIDDYLWAFGDGPQRAGNELLATLELSTAFCSGDTLYLRKK
ncbi:class I SAM-dependent methyltransferase [Aliikangiella marina]|uniref:Class I SAM-dependent methyltransferase n=1 Tax=Aliikangiella marina TaxID=1712262 RepID=A0A545TDN7_9GAMM|nr:class I SAM-dependent methyltransferase [Aliikangiella marina]TQV75325.1 class I SAM-dependent methyltransferase [Aliikangiella marina]